jgi:hypothetical protein
MFERSLSVKNISQALRSGETIEDYSADMPQPSRLILGFQGKRPFHVVIAEDLAAETTTIITVYRPSSGKWSKDFRQRRP